MPYPSRPFNSLDFESLHLYCDVWYRQIRHAIETFHPSIIHVHHLWLLASITAIAAEDIPVLVSVHGTDLRRAAECPYLAELIEPQLEKFSSFLLLTVKQERELFELYDFEPSSVELMGNGFNKRLFYPADADPAVLQRYGLAAPPGQKRIVCLAKFDPWKGIEPLIRAFSQVSRAITLQDVVLIIGGMGPQSELSRYEQLAADLGIRTRVHFPGQIAYEDVRHVLNSAHVVALPSYDEPFGLVLLEALACGTRIVTTDQSGILEHLPESLLSSGAVLPIRGLSSMNPEPEEDRRFVDELSQALASQLMDDLPSELRQTISDSVVHLSWETYARKLSRMYTGLANFPERPNEHRESTDA